ncbi:hypothetical protein CNMCM5793_008743 [Aspergillus hiratsukae]|uniref:Endo-polygalacturonase n=1 Tax=Aspergillus hiratsukae TaxID=1194566 RepID=A0A8H6P1B7_9EURO|nr:hypothetical protein CNMCM5793_008743 [Aspergillus hiratsukae]KAF7157991.1 hypothetical protein CNMCM6106_004280 [Aspergillus hiratsukae]
MLKRILLATAAAFLACDVVGQSCDNTAPVVVHPTAPGVINYHSYTVQVSSTGHKKEEYTVQPFLVQVGEANTTSGASIVHNTSVAYFDFCGSVEVSLTYHNGPVHSAIVRPYSFNIVPKVHGDTITFSLDSPKNVVVQVNDNIWDVLHLATNPIETDVPEPSDRSVIYFHPGINNSTAAGNLTNKSLLIPSGKTVYVAPGATVNLPLAFQNISDASIRGRGLLLKAPITIEYSSRITVRDLVLVNTNVGITVSTDVTVAGIRSFSIGAWGDGIDAYCSRNVLVDSVFMRNSDDNIALYQHRWNWSGDSSNLTIQNSALWADYAHPINIGTHGNTANPETMDGVTIRNIDVLDHREPQMWYQGCLAINAGDDNLIQNVLVDGMRVENFREGQLVNLRIMYNSKYNTSPGRGIRNVYIKGLQYNGTHANPSLVLGYDEQRNITNVTFEDLVVNGKTIYDGMRKPTWYYTADFVPMFANEHVHNLTFTQS